MALIDPSRTLYTSKLHTFLFSCFTSFCSFLDSSTRKSTSILSHRVAYQSWNV